MCNLADTTTGSFLLGLEAQGLVEFGYGQIGILLPSALRGLLHRDT